LPHLSDSFYLSSSRFFVPIFIDTFMTSLPRLRTGLLCNELDGQVLVYDPQSDTIHLLDATTGRVMEILRDRVLTEDEAVAELSRHTGAASNAALLELALEELRSAELLDEQPLSATPNGISRRDLLRKAGFAGAAAALIPTIVTLSATRAYGQTSCKAKKECCTVDADCCSNKCDASTGTGCTTGPLECH
jgi:PqqD family protein of HPr-rel-A system